MNLNENNFLTFLKNLNCFETSPNIALGVSGGPDSMALAYLLNKWVRMKKGKLYALIFDHRIRKNSKEESFKVKDMLKDLNIKSIIIKAKKNKLIKNNMSEARTNRFQGLTSYCKKNNIIHLFLGHHFDDNLETYLIRKINGSNLEGLGSINCISRIDNIQILRPLILTKKSSILNFNKKNKIKFLIDPSNENINYTRVKVRKFLENLEFKKLIEIDYINIKKKIPNYKKMIHELLLSSLLDIKFNKIIIDFDKLIKLNDLITEKIILLIVNFLSKKKYQTKSSKINIFIAFIKKPNFKIFNLNGVIIKKNSHFLTFSQK